VGTGNPGTTNALAELGAVPGLLTAAYDVSVGVVAIQIALLLGLSTGWAYVAGIMAVIGHRYPVFFGFRGGQGMAASAGMLVYGMGVALGRGWLSPTDLLVLVAAAAVSLALTRSATVVGVVVLPLLVAQLLLARPDLEFMVFMVALAINIWIVQLTISRREHLFKVVRRPHGSTCE
jgi:glycerol-3-phosphate acyltransferase PlsY